MLLRPAGHALPVDRRSGERRLLVHSAEGPSATVRWPGTLPYGPGGLLVAQTRQGAAQARALSPLEVWRVQGGQDAVWNAAAEAGLSPDLLVREAARACTPKMASALLGWGLALQGAACPAPAGLCPDPDEEEMWAEMGEWLGAWKENPQHPSQALAAVGPREADQDDDPPRGPTRAPKKKRARDGPGVAGGYDDWAPSSWEVPPPNDTGCPFLRGRSGRRSLHQRPPHLPGLLRPWVPSLPRLCRGPPSGLRFGCSGHSPGVEAGRPGAGAPQEGSRSRRAAAAAQEQEGW